MSEKPDLSTLLSILKNSNGNPNVKPEELLATLMNSSSTNSSSSTTTQGNVNSSKDATTSSTTSSDIPDMEMMMKLMRVMKSSNEDSPSKELLKSLKPFLNDSRKEKVDQYIKILGMTKALEMFQELGDTPK